jgi:transposase
MAYSLLPTEVFGVSGVTCWRRLRDWTRAGVWPELHRRLLDRMGKLGAIDPSKAIVDSQSVRAVFGGRTPAPVPWTAEKTAPNAM